MSIGELPELQVMLQNDENMGAIMHRVEVNGLNQLDHSWGRITAIEEVLTEMDNAD